MSGELDLAVRFLLFKWVDCGSFNEFRKRLISSARAIEVRLPNLFKREFHLAQATVAVCPTPRDTLTMK